MFFCLAANRFSQNSLLRLKQSGQVELEHSEDFTQMKSLWPKAQGLLIRSGVQVTDKLLKELPQLKVIVSATSGFDHIDFKACQARNITVMHTPGANAQSAAEHTWGLLLASQRRYPQAFQQVKSGQWQRATLMGQEISGKKLGIIGYGRIGQKVAKIAQAFDMKLFVHDPYIDQEAHPHIEFLGYEEVVRNSDIITFHVPYTTETEKMVKTNTLEWFHDQATLINASRGAVVHQEALLIHLSENPEFRVALDVFATEPLPKDSALLQNPNVLCTPHIGATTEQAIARASDEAVDKLLTFIKNGASSDTVPPQTLWAEKLLAE